MRGRAVWSWLGAASVLLVSQVSRAQCTKDTDCKGDRICEAGKCKSPVPVPPPAASEAPPVAAPPAASEAPPPAADATGATEGASPGAASSSPPPAPSPIWREEPASTPTAPAAATAPLGEDEPATRRRNRGAMIGGIVMVSVAPIAILVAVAAKNAQQDCDDALARDYPDHVLPTSERYRVDKCNGYSVPLYVFGIGGALLAGAGIPLIIYGAKKLPDAPPRVGLRVLPWAGVASSGLRLQLEL